MAIDIEAMTNTEFVSLFFERLSKRDVTGAMELMGNGAKVSTWSITLNRDQFEAHLRRQDAPRVTKATIVHDEGNQLDVDVEFEGLGTGHFLIELSDAKIQVIHNRMAARAGGIGPWPPPRP